MMALGSLCLLLGSALRILGFDPIGFIVVPFTVVTIVGFVLHLFGWVGLNDASVWPAMRVTFAASLVGFVVGVIVFLATVPNFGFFLLFGGWVMLPYTPFVWAPVVIAHAVLFLHFYARLGSGPPLLLLGSFALASVAGIGLVFQIAFLPEVAAAGFSADSALRWLSVLAGLTAVGYGIAAYEFEAEYEQRGEALGPFLRKSGAQRSR